MGLNDPILTNRNSSSRDNSIIIIKVLIGIIVYDLDVELNILICAVAKCTVVLPHLQLSSSILNADKGLSTCFLILLSCRIRTIQKSSIQVCKHRFLSYQLG